jgi:predicted amidohydrolase YtcJ
MRRFVARGRRVAIIVFFLVVALAAIATAVRTRAQAGPPADLVLVNGTVLTVDADDTIAQAVAIAGGKIVAVGSDDVVKARVGASTQVIDLHGRTATPGLIDTHVHFSEADALYSVELSDVSIRKMDDVLARIRAQVAKAKPGEWVRGRGWDEGKLAERRYITAADLDTVAPNNPVWLMHTTGHYGVANSYALKMAEVTKTTKDPPAGTIDRDAQDNPTGVMKEAAMALVSRHVPPLTREQQRDGLIRIIEDFNKEGMTGAKDPGIGQAKWELYQELLEQGKLTVRMFALWSGARQLQDNAAVLARVNANRADGQLPTIGDGILISGGVKMFMDGSGGARTAWMHEDWNKNSTEKDTGNTGYPATPPDDYRQIVTALHNAGIHVSTHAIGDRAIDWVVDTYAQALAAKPVRGLRHGIIHDNTPSDHAIDVMARLQRQYDAGYPESQATFAWWLGDNYAGNLGPARALRLNPFRTYVTKGIKWAGGSDYGVTPFAARYGLWASVARKTLNGTYGATPFGTAESIDIKTALRSYTIWAAHQIFLDDRVGSLEVGKDADIAVWDRNMYTVPTDDVKDLKCELTLLRGKVVYRAAAVAAAANVIEDWPQFRGPTGQGHSAERGLPMAWNESHNVLWKTPVPGRGWSSPVVSGRRVWLTTSVTDKGASLRAIAYDAGTGREAVNVELFHLRSADLTNPKNSHASPTPIVDGDRVYVHFGAEGTAALTTSGDIVWKARHPYESQHGNGGSPVLYGDLLIFSGDGSNDAFVVALDARTGRVRWKTTRRQPADQAYSTPLVIRVGDRDELVSVGAYRATAYDPQTGREIWRVSYGDGFSNVPRPVYGHGLVYIATGFQQPSLLAVRVDGSGDVTKTHVAWTLKRGAPLTPSPLLVGDELFVVNDAGIASCLDAKTGETHWVQRLGGAFSASPVFADGRIYFLSEEGASIVIAPGKEFRKLATSSLDGGILASMAVSGGSIFIRTETHLYRIAST